MGYVHYCVFCGHSAEADSATMLRPSCPGCGCALRACEAGEFPRISAALADQRELPRRARMDGAGPLAAMTAGPFLLPLIGVEIRDVIFAVPFVFLAFAAALCLSASRREGEPRGPWLSYSISTGIAAGSVAVGIVMTIAGHLTALPYYLGTAASLALLVGVLLHLSPRIAHAQLERVLDAAQLLVLVVASGVFFVVIPGLRDGDGLLTLVFVIDLMAFVGAGLLAVAGRRAQDIRVGRRLWAATFFVLVPDGLVAADAAGVLSAPETLGAAFYAVAAWFIAGAAVAERPAPMPAGKAEPEMTAEWRWLTARILVPTLQVVAFPLVLALALASVDDRTLPLAWFGGAFVLVLLAAFGRQAYLVIDHRRAVIEERRIRRKAQRRNEELEALTGLATTMTQTLEEAPIVEQALTVLHTAARATSSALHLREEHARRKLRATAGNWQAEHPWADRFSDADQGEDIVRYECGGRQVTRLPLTARDHDIGWVTFVRPESAPLGDRELELLRLLVDQMAIAIQNARDYREKLEQAVRDPLTGVYNRRYFFEALEKEVQRSRRYGSHAALVLFDLDDFKRINDTHGHATGDAVLRGIAAVVAPLLRPVDSFARIGGEEFALLLPETRQLDALLVAERMRSALSRAEMVPGLRVTVSAGVGACPADAPSRDELVRRTDAALYWAKRNGKDMCAVVNDATDAGTAEVKVTGAAASHLTQLVAAIDAERPHTAEHSQRVAGYAVALGQALGLAADQLVRLRRAALLHDVGLVAVRAEVLDKPGPLSEEEWTEMRLHPGVGAAMVRHAGFEEEARWIRHHHERIDGRGYPDGLAGDAIPLESRIILIAEAFEAMTADRPHRPAMTAEVALAEMRKLGGAQFEARLVRRFHQLLRTGAIEAPGVKIS
jgi:diguanylate cyclase (GGDEF)-like protein